MARVNFTGFETQVGVDEAGGTLSGTGATIETGANVVKSGGGWLRVNTPADATNHFFRVGSPLDGTAFSVATSFTLFSFAFVTKPSSGDETIVIWSKGTSGSLDKCSLRLNSSGNLAFYDNNTALVATGSTVLSANTKYKIGAKVGTGASAAWEITINGTSEMSGTADLDVVNLGSVLLGRGGLAQSKAIDVSYDDVIIDDAAYPAQTATIALIKANGNGTYTAWTGDSTDVDDVPPEDGDTTDIDTATNLNAESATMEDSATVGITGTVNSVKTNVIGRNTGTAIALQARLRSGTTDNDSANYSTTSSYTGFGHVLNTDPNGGGAWTLSGLDGIEVGVEHNQSQARTARVTALYAMVDYTPSVSVDPSLIIPSIAQLSSGGFVGRVWI